MNGTIKQVAVFLMIVLISLTFMPNITESMSPRRHKYRLSRKLTQPSVGNFRGSSCATDKSRRLCSVNPASWVSGLAECCPGYKCLVTMQTVPGLTITRIRPQCKVA